MNQNNSHIEINWTVIILIYAEIKHNSAEQMEAGIEKSVKEFEFIVKTAKLVSSSDYYIIKNVVDLSADENDLTNLIKVQPGDGSAMNEFRVLKTFKTDRIAQKKNELANVFKMIKIPIQNKVMLLTWDHGSVFGIFKTTEEIANGSDHELIEKNVAAVRYKNDDIKIVYLCNKTYRRDWEAKYYDKRLFTNKDLDEIKRKEIPDLLTGDEIADVIFQGLNRKVDILIMMNCWMQNIHTCFALQKNVDYFIAPENLITAFTYDYKFLLENLKNNDSQEVCRKLFENLLDTYTFKHDTSTSIVFKNDLDQLSLFAINLNLYKSLINSVLGLINLLITTLRNTSISKQIKSSIVDARSKTFAFDKDIECTGRTNFNYYMIDLIMFLEKLSDDDNIEIFNDKLIDIKQKMNATYFCPPHIGNDIYHAACSIQSHKNFKGNSMGAGIYFPKLKSEHANSFLQQVLVEENSISFYRITDWITFLETYYDSRPIIG